MDENTKHIVSAQLTNSFVQNKSEPLQDAEELMRTFFYILSQLESKKEEKERAAGISGQLKPEF